ncbi:hypothetical protein CVT24_009655 [Panaeolus cyanescens]|uniref:Uncharacterized protein n=1 Tax=Panaeolus cyanescens TaxID=181874 RepID=A0A409Y9H5_9AGAR|nr:hypothetical protein CVT24_009655 [Panaeolus cyanescens]
MMSSEYISRPQRGERIQAEWGVPKHSRTIYQPSVDDTKARAVPLLDDVGSRENPILVQDKPIEVAASSVVEPQAALKTPDSGDVLWDFKEFLTDDALAALLSVDWNLALGGNLNEFDMGSLNTDMNTITTQQPQAPVQF